MSAGAFPVGIALASTWNTDLVHKIGQALAEEAQSKGARVLLAPTVNIHRSPLNGRNFECYSEDPYLSARMAVAYVDGVQSKGLSATIKHFVGNDAEFQRTTISSEIDERTRHEICLVGLVVYTGAFIAEVIRAGILAVQKGQVEAAKAIGLKPLQILRLVVLPLAMRVIIPPLISQYLNLIKNSSLAVVIGYADLFFVGRTIINQAGQAVPVFLMIMGCYLAISLLTSAVMNVYNRRVQLVER